MSTVPALVLAGSRGPDDPLLAGLGTRAAGVSHKAFLPVGGVPMLLRVVRALCQVPNVGPITVSIERPDLVAAEPELATLLSDGRLRVLEAAGSPSRSVGAALTAIGTPLLVTTADHALLRPEWVVHFWDAVPAGVDIAAAVARADVVERAVPGTKRTYLRFAEGAFSGCNLFAVKSPAALGIVEFWRQVEADRKNPLKMLGLLGPSLVTRYTLGTLPLADALARLKQLTGAKGAVVELPFGAAAVDVDKPADLDVAERLLAGPPG